MMEHLKVTYRIDAPEADVRELTESVMLEQSIETPASVAMRYPYVREHMIGKVLGIEPEGPDRFRVVVSLPSITAAVDPAQFLNVLYGNSSLHENVYLLDFELSETVIRQFPGPRFGLEGIRERTGVKSRPLTCSALKPVGLTVKEIAGLCRDFALGGIDVIKDDHYLSDHPFCPFEERVQACQRAVEEAAGETGRRSIYMPNLSGTPEQVLRQAEFAQRSGVGAVMAAPMLIGLPFFLELVQQHLDVPVFAHPAFAGSTRIREDTLLGKVFRLFGADAIIFASYGGRFGVPREVCSRIAQTMRSPWHQYRAALPVPAGGMRAERAQELVAFYGMDTMLLVGGSLLEAGNSLAERTRTFTESVARAASETAAK